MHHSRVLDPQSSTCPPLAPGSPVDPITNPTERTSPSRMGDKLSLDWLFGLLGGCEGGGRNGRQAKDYDEVAGFVGLSSVGRRHSLGSMSVTSACSSSSAPREDHWQDARNDLKKHVLKMEGLSNKVQVLGLVRAPSHKPSGWSAQPPSHTERSIASVFLAHLGSKTSESDVLGPN